MILNNKTILITGGTGSLGKVMVRRILAGQYGEAEKVIVLSRDEAKQHEMRLSYMDQSVTTDEVIYRNFQRKLEFRIGDVRSYGDICSSVRDVNIVINAAALKQVPSCEYFPEQAVLTNCIGPMNIVRAIRENNLPVETVVGVSTDKACKPVNVMGMTKSIQERIFISANILNQDTRFVGVRYGNVLASRGSVIPLFYDQITKGGPVTITVPEMTRFLLTLDEAVDTVMAAIRDAHPGDIFVPRAPSSTVSDIAKALVGDRNIQVKIIGIRPGEKMHEIMVSEEESINTIRCGSYFSINSMLPELRPNQLDIEDLALNGEYSSEFSVIGLVKVKEILERNNLMVGGVGFAEDGELLR